MREKAKAIDPQESDVQTHQYNSRQFVSINLINVSFNYYFVKRIYKIYMCNFQLKLKINYLCSISSIKFRVNCARIDEHCTFCIEHA